MALVLLLPQLLLQEDAEIPAGTGSGAWKCHPNSAEGKQGKARVCLGTAQGHSLLLTVLGLLFPLLEEEGRTSAWVSERKGFWKCFCLRRSCKGLMGTGMLPLLSLQAAQGVRIPLPRIFPLLVPS